MRRKLALALILALAVTLAAAAWHAGMLSPNGTAGQEDVPFAVAAVPPGPATVDVQPGPFQETEWFALVPRDWEPARTFSDDVARLGDNDPRAMDALVKLREAWANAPVEPAMDGQRIRIGGFVIPLDSENGAVLEFLLVPYFGACIHAPPPPANQVIHVFPRQPVRDMTMMQPVLVSGTLHVARDRSPASAAGLVDTIGYEMQAQSVAAYEEK